MNLAGRHVFWNPPTPMLGNRFRTVPLAMGRQFLGMGGPFMGQERSLDRLENLTIPAIQNRILTAPPVQKYFDAVQGAQSTGGFKKLGPINPAQNPLDPLGRLLHPSGMPTLTEDEKTVLTLISLDPTEQELADLAIIDGFFPGQSARYVQGFVPDLTQQICQMLKSGKIPQQFGGFGRGQIQPPSPAEAIAGWMLYKPAAPTGRWAPRTTPEPNVTQDEIDSITGNKFFCQDPNSYPYNNSNFGIDPSQAWGTIKMKVQNAITMAQVIADYPFPPPIDEYKGTFWQFAASDIQQMININSPLDPEAIRFWITLFVIGNYNAMVDKITSDLKRKAKAEKRKNLLKVIGLAVLGVIAAFVLPAVIAVIVTAIKTAVTTYVDIQKRKEAAKAMAESAKLFEKDAPAFSAEADKTAKLLDEVTALQTANQKPDPEMQAAIDEVAAETPGTSPLLPIAGIAAAGVGAFLLFR